MLVQKRRQGLQVFGGWRGQADWFGWLYGCHTELWDEASIDLWRHHDSVQQMAGPFLVVQNLPHSDSKRPDTCMVLIAVLDDKEFSRTASGALAYAGRPVWSREISRKYSGVIRNYYDIQTEPTADEIELGQFGGGCPIFTLVDAQNLESSEWRGCDWITLQLLQRQVETLSSRFMSAEEGDRWRWMVVHFASVHPEYVKQLRIYTTLLRTTACKFIAVTPWPLLTHGQVVEDRQWRLGFNTSHNATRRHHLSCPSRRLRLLRRAKQKRGP